MAVATANRCGQTDRDHNTCRFRQKYDSFSGYCRFRELQLDEDKPKGKRTSDQQSHHSALSAGNFL
jgi:hypothetical protein